MTTTITAATVSSQTTLPLTSAFTLQTSCFSIITEVNNLDYHWLGLSIGLACLPSGTRTDDHDFAFSTALHCPYSHTTTQMSQTQKDTGIEARVICCLLPSGMSSISEIVFSCNSDTDHFQWYTSLKLHSNSFPKCCSDGSGKWARSSFKLYYR